jgi:hypothetical protein
MTKRTKHQDYRRLWSYASALALVAACSGGGTKTYYAKTSGVGAGGGNGDQTGGTALSRTFNLATVSEVSDKAGTIVAVHQSTANASQFVFMTKESKSFVYDAANGSVATVEGAAKFEGTTQVLALPDKQVWFLTSSGVGRSVGDLSNPSQIKGLRLPLEFPAEGPRIIGVGNAWLALYFSGKSYIVTCDGTKLSASSVQMPESIFGATGPFAGGKTKDDASVWFWGLDGLRSLSPGGGQSAWIKTPVNFNLSDAGQIKAVALSLSVSGQTADVPGSIVVVSDKGIYLSKGQDANSGAPSPAPQPGPTGPLTFAKDIKPLNDKYCIVCHGAGSASGDYSTEQTWLDDAETIINRVVITKKGQGGVMPTVAFGAQPSDAERATMVKYLQPSPQPSTSPSPSPSPTAAINPQLAAALNTDGGTFCSVGACHPAPFVDYVCALPTRKQTSITRIQAAASPMPTAGSPQATQMQAADKQRLIQNLNMLP